MVSLTDTGRALIERAFAAHEKAMERATAGLSAAERRQAVELLKKLGRHAAALE
jgi:MarR family 2-MHQ and catechol resistance regulon transcriptional repressor